MLDKQQWMKVLDGARASRYAMVFSSELVCNYGTVKDALALVSCSCATADGAACEDENLTSLSGNNIGYFTCVILELFGVSVRFLFDCFLLTWSTGHVKEFQYPKSCTNPWL